MESSISNLLKRLGLLWRIYPDNALAVVGSNATVLKYQTVHRRILNSFFDFGKGFLSSITVSANLIVEFKCRAVSSVG